MPTTLELIEMERMAFITFMVADVLAFSSTFKSEEAFLQNRNKTKASSGINKAAVEANSLALDSTVIGALGYYILLIIEILRKEQLEQENQSGTSNTSTVPNELLIVGLFTSLLGSAIRVPAIEQRLSEAQRPVIL